MKGGLGEKEIWRAKDFRNANFIERQIMATVRVAQIIKIS